MRTITSVVKITCIFQLLKKLIVNEYLKYNSAGRLASYDMCNQQNLFDVNHIDLLTFKLVLQGSKSESKKIISKTHF